MAKIPLKELKFKMIFLITIILAELVSKLEALSNAKMCMFLSNNVLLKPSHLPSLSKINSCSTDLKRWFFNHSALIQFVTSKFFPHYFVWDIATKTLRRLTSSHSISIWAVRLTDIGISIWMQSTALSPSGAQSQRFHELSTIPFLSLYQRARAVIMKELAHSHRGNKQQHRFPPGNFPMKNKL